MPLKLIMYVCSYITQLLQQTEGSVKIDEQSGKLNSDFDKRFKAHYREIERENRFYDREKDKEKEYEQFIKFKESKRYVK